MALKRKAEEDAHGIESHVECPVCFSCPILPPIRQCPNGHVLCDECAGKVPCCPTCKAEPVNIRNLVAEGMLQGVQVQCPHAPFCRKKVKYSDMAAHMVACECRPIACPALKPCSTCAIPMDAAAVVKHLCDVHYAGRIPQDRVVVDPNAATVLLRFTSPLQPAEEPAESCVLAAHGDSFVAHFLPLAEDYAVWLQHIGPATRANRFSYLVSTRGSSRLLQFRSCPRSVRATPDEVLTSGDCLFIRRRLALFMSGKEGCNKGLDLQFRFVIKHHEGDGDGVQDLG